MVQDCVKQGHGIAKVDANRGVSALVGQSGLADSWGRARPVARHALAPKKSPRAIEPRGVLVIVERRQKLNLQAPIASCLGVSAEMGSRIAKRTELSKLSDLRTASQCRVSAAWRAAANRDQESGRFGRTSHRIIGYRTCRAHRIGWVHVFVAADHQICLAFDQNGPDECKHSAQAHLRSALALVRAPGRNQPAAAGRRRQVVPLRVVRLNRPDTGHPRMAHPRVLPAHHWQGRSLNR